MMITIGPEVVNLKTIFLKIKVKTKFQMYKVYRNLKKKFNIRIFIL